MKRAFYFFFIFLIFSSNHYGQNEPAEYLKIKQTLATGWNTWNTRSVTSHVLLPEGFAINLAFKQHYWLEEQYLDESLIGRSGPSSEHIIPGPHTFNGSYTKLELKWEEVHVLIESAHDGDEIVILVKPLNEPENKSKLIIESALLWNRSGLLRKNENSLEAVFDQKIISVYTTGKDTVDFYVETKTPYLSVFLHEPIGISTGKPRDIHSIMQILERERNKLQDEAKQFGDLAEDYIAVQAGIAWNTIYEPKYDRVVSTVGRLWNKEYGGYCLFGWDNFFLAYMTGLYSRELAIANVIEHMKSATEEGFIPNDDRGNGSKSFDRSQPPVGSIMVKEIYKMFPEKWFLETVFDGLIEWNEWWLKKRLNEGLLSYGSHLAINPFNESNVYNKIAAGYESGMDDSPMYIGVPFNKEKNTLELQDVGLNSLFIADCKALAEMAEILGRKDDRKILLDRARSIEQELSKLWQDDIGLYLNYKTDVNEFSYSLSPTLFYPMLAGIPSQNKATRMLDEHFYNPDEFYGDWILPSIARNDSLFYRQRYWKGAIWPPLNFLTYLSLRNYDFKEAEKELSDKSLKLLINEWERKGYVSENYSSITGTGDDERLSSDRFHSWGALFGIIAFIQEGFLPPTEMTIKACLNNK